MKRYNNEGIDSLENVESPLSATICSAPGVGDWVRSVNNPRLQGLVIEDGDANITVDFGWGIQSVLSEMVEVCDVGDYNTDLEKQWLRKFLHSIESST